MNRITKSERSCFSEFSSIFKNRSEIPEAILKEIPEDASKKMEQGNQAFFKNYLPFLPQFYDTLTNHCTPVRLLEMICEGGFNPANIDNTSKAYYWGLTCNGVLITAPLQKKVNEKVSKILRKKYIAYLPEILHCCYEVTVGISVASYIGPDGFDLPQPSYNWRELYEYYEDHSVPMKERESLAKQFPNSDMRIYIESRDNDLILLDYYKKDKKLYHVKNNVFSKCRLISNVDNKLDQFFSNALLGFPKTIDLSSP